MQSCARIAFEIAKSFDEMGVVVDADGLWLVQVSAMSCTKEELGAHRQSDPKVVLDWPGIPRVILTPNLMEFKRLCQTMVRQTHLSIRGAHKLVLTKLSKSTPIHLPSNSAHV